jgi:hypothetical protein
MCVSANRALAQQRIKNSLSHWLSSSNPRIRVSLPAVKNSEKACLGCDKASTNSGWGSLSPTPKMLQNQKSSDAPFGVTRWLDDIFVCQSRFQISVFLPVWFSYYVNHPPTPLTHLSPGKEADPGERRGGENDFTQIQFLASISNFLSLTKWKFVTKGQGGWSGWVKYAPFPLPPATDRPPDVDCGAIVVAFWSPDCDTIND